MKRGMEILQSNGKSITENEDGSFSVPSQMQTSIVYDGLVQFGFVPVLILKPER
jgi:hypothetical protein